MRPVDLDALTRADQRTQRLLTITTVLHFATLAIIIALVLFASTARAQVPADALRYRADLTRTAHAVWGLDAPVSTFAAQIHQESAWSPGAVSRVGAAGLAQFMPTTAKWIAGLYPELRSNQPFNPAWSMRAMVTYNRWLHERVRASAVCDRWAMVMSAYNGGLGWVQRDQTLAASQGLDKLTWWDSVETVNAGRSAANWRENRDYPRRILLRYEPIYIKAGWGPGVCT